MCTQKMAHITNDIVKEFHMNSKLENFVHGTRAPTFDPEF
jgi:hypothetical protein